MLKFASEFDLETVDFMPANLNTKVCWVQIFLKRLVGLKDEVLWQQMREGFPACTEVKWLTLNESTCARIHDSVQSCFGLLGHPGEHHRDVITCVLISAATHDHSCAIHRRTVMRRLERHGHLNPTGESCLTAKFDAAFVDGNRVRRKGEAGLA